MIVIIIVPNIIAATMIGFIIGNKFELYLQSLLLVFHLLQVFAESAKPHGHLQRFFFIVESGNRNGNNAIPYRT